MVVGIVDELHASSPSSSSATGGGAPWAGLDNYRVAVDFNGPVGGALLHSFSVTFVFTVLVGRPVPGCSACRAAMLLQGTFRGRGLLRTLFLVPYALPVYAAVITWSFMFQRDNGLVNHVLHRPACTSPTTRRSG